MEPLLCSPREVLKAGALDVAFLAPSSAHREQKASLGSAIVTRRWTGHSLVWLPVEAEMNAGVSSSWNRLVNGS